MEVARITQKGIQSESNTFAACEERRTKVREVTYIRPETRRSSPG